MIFCVWGNALDIGQFIYGVTECLDWFFVLIRSSFQRLDKGKSRGILPSLWAPRVMLAYIEPILVTARRADPQRRRHRARCTHRSRWSTMRESAGYKPPQDRVFLHLNRRSPTRLYHHHGPRHAVRHRRRNTLD